MRRADLVVIGGGLAGALAVEAALDAQREVVWIDAGDARASDAPCALVHPFVGGSFRPRPGVVSAWNAARQWFAAHGSGFVHHAPVRRQIPSSPRGDRLLRSWSHADATARELFEHVVAPTPDSRFVEYGPVFAVELHGLLRAQTDALIRRGAGHRRGRVLAIEPGRRHRWTLHLVGERTIDCRTVVVASGAGSRALLGPWIERGTLGLAEGVLAYAEGPPMARFSIFGGHASSGPNLRAWGATYRMLDVADARGHASALNSVDARVRSLAPELPALSDARRWGATRLIDLSQRRPWVRPMAPGLLAFTAFGSQGCLWGPWCGLRLRETLDDD